MKIDSSYIVPCPLRGFALRRVALCLSCEHYQGMAQETSNGVPVGDVSRVICGKPIGRRIQRIEID